MVSGMSIECQKTIRITYSDLSMLRNVTTPWLYTSW